MTGDAMTQQGAGAAGCVRDRTPASAPGLAVIPAFLNSCRIPRLVVRKLFKQCIVKGRTVEGEVFRCSFSARPPTPVAVQ